MVVKVLNLYAGIGGNRKGWENVEVTAIENNPIIAKIYKSFFPQDKVIVTDAHEYLLNHYKDYDFIWSSPPCPSHSLVRKNILPLGRMRLYEEIIFLEHHARCKYVVENVKSYNDPLIKPQHRGRHYFWANFYIKPIKVPHDLIKTSNIKLLEENKGFNLDKVRGLGKRKDQVLKNCVNSKLGKHIFACAFQKPHDLDNFI